MNTKQRWQDWLNLFLGVWLVTAPFAGIGMVNGIAAWNAYIFGIIVVVLAAAALRQPQAWEEWINLVVGLWLIAAPFVLGFSTQVEPTWNHVVVGVVVCADALWAALPKARSSQPSHHVR